MGLLGRLKDALSVEEALPVKRPTRGCNNCKFWVGPAELTTKVVSSQHAIEWARGKNLGRCTAPRSDQSDDRKRFTQATALCEQHAKR